ncbi:MAG: S8 family serine peptidase, partial [Candidatus Altiarchaeota archaeon]|nr:S8 family serine peptidase [Candidatus Altiarchaeota archaeon]
MADRRRDIRICLVLFLFLSLAFAGISEARNKMDERQVFSSLGLMIPGEDSENKVVPKYRDLAYGLPETPLIPYTKQQEQLENKGIRIIVSLKDPIEVDGWGKRIHSLDKSQIRYLEKNMMEYVIKETGKNSVKHRYSSFNGFSVIVPREKIPELERNGLVKWIEYDMPMQVMLEDTVELINADEAWGFKDANGAGLTGKGQAVCVVDTGVDYTHPDLGGCEIEYVNGTAKNRVVESDHPYDNNFSHVWTITESGFDGIAVHFKNISVEGYFDKIYIKDGGGTTVETWTGSYEDVWSVSVPGDTIKINLVTDYSITDYGFYIDKVLNGSVEKPYWSNCSKVIGGYDFYNLDSDPMDDHSHGTHCAGIVAANGNIKGVAPGANIVAVKVLSAYGSGAESDVVAGIEYCNNHSDEYNISVISMSLGSGSLYSSYCDSAYLSFSLAINQSFNKNISVVIASGNSGDCSEISAPACIETAVPIASTTKSEEISYFSNRNQLVQLMAPGSDINSTVLGGAYAVHSGTSMATPHAAGAFAIYHQKLESKGISSTPWQVEEDFHSTGKTIQDTCSGRSYSRIDLTFLGKNTSLTKTLSDNLIGLENNEKALFEMEIKELGGNDLTNHRLIDEYNTSILNYSNAIPEPDTVNLSTGKVEWVINLSPGSSQTIRLNLTPTKIGETINWVYLINQSGTELMNDSVDLTIIQHDYCGEKIKNTLNLTSNLVCARNGLEVDKNNLVIDCQGHTISGASPESNYGIMLEQVQNITLKNCDLKDFNCGISLNYSTENRVLDNTISYTEIGILADSSNN